MKRMALPLCFLMCLCLVVSSGAAEWGGIQQGPGLGSSRLEKNENAEEPIIPGPKDIKQATALYVFVGWLWLCIGICVYVLRLKIKEADRLVSLDYFSENK